jgi:hypothetical protein
VAVYTHTVRTETADSVPNLRLLEDQADKTEKGLRRMEDRAGKVGSAAGRLGGVLGRVNPALEEGARVVNDFADGLEVAGGLSGSLLRVLGPVAVAAGALGGAYLILKQRLDAANQAMETASNRADQMVAIHTRVKEAALLAALATGEITQEQFNASSAAQTAADLYREQVRAQRDLIRTSEEAVKAKEAEVAIEREALTRQRESMENDELFRATHQQQIDNFKETMAELDALNRSRDREVNALDTLTEAQNRYAENLRIVADNQSTAATTTTQVTEAIEQQAEAVMSLSEAFEAAGFRTGPGATGLGVDLDAPFAERSAALQERMELLQRQIEVRQRLAALPGVGGDTAGPSGLQTAMGALGAGAGNVGAALGMIANPMSALGALGPVGAVLGGLSAIGNVGAGGVEDQLDSLLTSITAGIRALPEILLDVIPEFVGALVLELPQAIADALAELLRRIFFGDGDGEAVTVNPRVVQAQQEQQEFLSQLQGLQQAPGNRRPTSTGRSARAATAGRLARADGATRLAISRAPTASQSQASVVVNALGVDDGTQDAFLRRFAQFTDPDTGLRGRN